MRHENADTSPLTIERSDAIDAAGALIAMASRYRKDARSRAYGGPAFASDRAWLRTSANIYEAAAQRIQRACDAAI